VVMIWAYVDSGSRQADKNSVAVKSQEGEG